MATEWFERIIEGKFEATCCRRRLIVHCHMCQTSDDGVKGKQDSVILSPSTGEEELPLMIPHQRWSHDVEKSDAHEAFRVSR